MEIRKKPNVAGTFYPGTKKEIDSMLDLYLKDAKEFDIEPKALIAPHAGYIFSAPIAATAYKTLIKMADKIDHVAVLSPSHYFAFSGMAITDAEIFETPLGDIPVNKQMVEALMEFPQVSFEPGAFEREHALEVHLPFLQKTLKKFTLIPIIVGPTHPDDVKEVIEFLMAKEKTLLVISSDLSHFKDYETCRVQDAHTSKMIEDKLEDKIDHEDACGYYPLKGALLWAQERGLSIKTVDLRNSGDTAGDKARVVGYGSYLIY